MIAGMGSDLVEVSRIRGVLERRGEAFARRVLADSEFAEWQVSGAPDRLLARRFAAKEAVLKALGTGLRDGIRWQDVAVDHDSRGKPEVILAGKALVRFQGMAGRRLWLSISDERHYALAFAIIEAS